MNVEQIALKLRMLRLYRFHIREWWRDIWKQDAWARMCCDGYMCGCHGSCYADMWEHLLKEQADD